MLKLTPFCLAAVLLLQAPLAAAHAAPVSAALDPAVAARIDAIVAPYYKAGEPGATLIVTRDGKTLLRKAYGMADVAKGVRMQPGATMRLGSITKQFTSTAILMLADEGKLVVSDPITKFLPDYPTHGKNITIEHLLTHTSGIVSYTGKPNFEAQSQRDLTVAQMIDTFKDDPLEFEPGSRYAYNNSGYFLLGAIIEKVSGQTYASFVEQRIFAPLGMHHSAYEGLERQLSQRAAGHSKEKGNFEPSAPLSMSQPYAAGSLVSSVDDLARWDAAVSSGKLLKPASWALAFKPYTLADGKSTNYGYGWGVGKLRGAKMISHGGGINGFSTYALRIPEKNVYVALLSNADGGLAQPSFVAKKAAAAAIGDPFPEMKAVKVEASALDSVAGVYKIDEKSNRTVRRNEDHLLMQRGERPAFALYPLGGDRFFAKDSLVSFRFARNPAGAVTDFVMEDDGMEIVQARTGDLPPVQNAAGLHR